MAKYSPMMTQYFDLKAKYPDTLVFYRIGDFYEMFYDDAITASRELDLVLTGRNAGVEEKAPMCGVPHHAVENYLQKLVAKGYKIAIVEQLENPAEAVGLVKRDVIRIVTPGTAMDEMQDGHVSICIAALEDYGYGYALAICEMTTGETRIVTINHDNVLLRQTLLTNDVREIVLASNFNRQNLRGINDDNVITASICDETELKPEYKELARDTEDVHLIVAIGRLLNYLEITQRRSINHLLPFEMIQEDNFLQMDYASRTNLELVSGNHGSTKDISLWRFLDKTCSAAGSRNLKKWIIHPLRDEKKINQRLDMIAYLNKNFIQREQLKDSLSNLYDIERLIARVGYGSANGKDCVRLQKSLQEAPQILEIVRKSGIYPEFDDVDCCPQLNELLLEAIVEDPPVSTKDGGIFRAGYNQQLDEYRQIQTEGRKWLTELEQKEKDRTGIKNLRIGYNRVFGYYIEISKGNLPLVKEEWGYQRKQTLTTGERFITEELKEREDAIVHAEERAINLESALFDELLEKIRGYLSKLQRLANALANIDSIYSLAMISSQHGYVRPSFNNEGILNIKQGRHPILETLTEYIPNDVQMDREKRIQIITGPNMGGKSTYMRQVALLVIMAQMGCYIPAKKAELPVFDQIFTRIGSSDDILAGQSTFMVEMTEANNALQKATKDSLILFDEIGRGTATYDGMALAQAILEYIDVAIEAKTLFSTHYHELTALENNMNGIINKHVAVLEENERIEFLYKVQNGKANRSYGIHVAALAKLPQSVLARATQLLKELESKKQTKNDLAQIVMIEKEDPKLKEVRETLLKVDVNNITPIEALQLIDKLKEKVKDEQN
ncbi:MAG: DNA mismatch repair protein MutS [Erysipelotrichaceae bacterium]|nr:DNA mismatch repair protein MutS [Erysipelotrichaceae bacterium]